MKLTLPNLLSLLRMGIVPLFIIAVLKGDAGKALTLFVVAGISDALDGALARWLDQQSLLGTYLDPIADKILLTSAYVTLSIPALNQGAQIPIWVTVLVLARDVLLVVVALILYLAAGVRSFPVTLLSKVTTVVQVITVGLVLISSPQLVPSLSPIAELFLYAVVVLTVASGLYYIYRVNRLERHGDKA
jgi:cardiolipin synthase